MANGAALHRARSREAISA